MVMQKASSSLLGQYKVMTGMEEKHEVLKRKLTAILDVIDDAEMQAADHKQGRKLWLEAVRKMAYQGNDIFDEFKYEALRHKAKKEGQYRELGMDVMKLFPTHNRFVFRIKMGKKLSMILQNIDILIGEMFAFNFQSQPQQQLPMEWRHTDSDIIDPMEIASKSRAREKEMIVDTLLGQKSNEDLTVLPIFGMGGLGKTTLSQLVYNDSEIRDHFQLLVWLCVSNSFDVDFVATRIVEAITNSTVTVGKSPRHSLGEAVSGKRYLLVLDDVWDRDAEKWDKLKFYLGKGDMGSSILTTTRDEYIARFMGTTEPYKLGLLDPSFIEEIIKAKAFISKASSPANELVVMVGDMAKKCAGSPLAASALGSVLRTKTSEKEWKAILRRTTICDNEIGTILSILRLSYNDLPSQMRQCFSFCAVFPKDYEIDVETLIQLWMSNGFILEEQGVWPESRGKQIFTELTSRSFFQIVKEVPFDYHHVVSWSEHEYCSRITCKIHDLMHDVAQSAMGKECATIATGSGESEDFSYCTRHLFVQDPNSKVVLNGFLEKSSPGLQTLLCTIGNLDDKELQFLSKYNSVRALKISYGSSILKPKYLHHLKYLDLSKSSITVLPEDISILYHLQTLNLSCCRSLAQLPKGMKYMTALRHLYTDGCSGLKMMPLELRCLTSLQTLTWFVVGKPGPSCGGIAELGPLDDLDGRLEVRKLENVSETDVQAANLGNKKSLSELTLRWSEAKETTHVQHNHHNEVLEGMKPHDGIKVLRLYSYGGSTCPAWMNTLHDVVELVLSKCKNIEKLPPLWQLPALRFLGMSGMEKLQFFCCGGEPPFTFKKMKALGLHRMSNLEKWCDINEVQGQEPMFPELEKLKIMSCRKLTALPRVLSQVVNTTMWQSAFPALKELKLYDLKAFERWEAAEETLDQHIMTFPLLEKLIINNCPNLSTLPEAPKLNVLKIVGKGSQQIGLLTTFLRWGAAEGTLSEQIMTFPSLEKLVIDNYSGLTTLPKAPKLNVLEIRERGSQQIGLHVAKRYITSLSTLKLSLENDRDENSLIELLGDEEKWNLIEPSGLRVLHLEGGCSFLFLHSSAPSLWNCFVQLEALEIKNCHAVEHWPENMFQGLVSLRTLRIEGCNKLTGRTQQAAASEQPTLPESRRSRVLPPHLESIELQSCGSLEGVPTPLPASLTELHIHDCGSLVEITNQLPASLGELSIYDCPSLVEFPTSPPASAMRKLHINGCAKLESVFLPPRLEFLLLWDCDSLVEISPLPASLMLLFISCCDKLESVVLGEDGDGVGIRQERSAVIPISSTSVVPNLSPSTTTLHIHLDNCSNLHSLSGQLGCIESLVISSCERLKSADGDLSSSLKYLIIQDCDSLESIPDGPPQAAYSSLRVLGIRGCPRLKVLPLCLKQRLIDLEETDVDARYTGTRLSRSWNRLMGCNHH